VTVIQDFAKPKTEQKWRFRSRTAAHTRASPLWLYPELDGSSCVGDLDAGTDGKEQLAYYVDYVRSEHPQWWAADAVPILWSVHGDGVCEFAPSESQIRWLKHEENFLAFWTLPVDTKTGGPLNWWRLPVRNTRFPEFAKALGWLPSPFHEFAPLRSIIGYGVSARTT
jgi:hypothetical protein